MAFQVKEFDSIQKGGAIEWKFKLINKTSSQFNFYELEQSSRTLLNLAHDMTGQIEIEMESRRNHAQSHNRLIRKACQKIIKSLNLSVASFAIDIDEQLQTVKAFFKKQKLPEQKLNSILQKCKRWAMSAWLSLQNQQFFNSTEKFIQSFIKDGKKTNPEFDQTNELYGVIIGGQETTETHKTQRQHQSLIQIDVNLTIDNKYISECLLYNTENLSYIKTRTFSQHFVNDLLKQNSIEGISKESIQQLEEEVRIQIRSQCLYKTLLKKHAHVLLNFSTIDIPPETREYLIPIEVKLSNENDEVEYEDYFQWDVLNESNNIEQFCQQLIEDADLDPKYFSQLCYTIRTEINAQLQWKFMLLVKTFKQIHKERESPKLNTQTTAVIRKNLPYAMDVLMLPENKSYSPPENIVFANSDVFSLLSRNMDILPEEFQSILLEKQGGKDSSAKTEEQVEKTQVTTTVKSSSRVRNLADIYEKKGIKVETNPYLSGVSNLQSMNVWKRLMDQKTTCQ